ncbi:DNA primase [Sulfolobus acidocaldarius SUSAZ]|nr:DNA primase [Sulfolobus acidocaldarius SUSAZ]
MQISISLQGQSKIIYQIFRSYYENAVLELPQDIELREFAYQPFNSDTYVRHLTFSSVDELKSFILSNVPLHLYFSAARYQIPSAKEMEQKGWLGSDLLFDLDADDICEINVRRFCDGMEILSETCDGEIREISEITVDCINRVFENALVLKDILVQDFGLKPRIFFSGNRGFHVRVDCYNEWANLESEDRREIAEYIMSPSPPYESNSESSPGWLGRFARGINGVKIDEQVTIDPKRLVRIPGSLNGKAGLKVVEIINDKFEYGEYLSPFDGIVAFQSNLSGKFNVLGHQIELRRGEVIKLSAKTGVYLALKGYGVIKAYVR